MSQQKGYKAPSPVHKALVSQTTPMTRGDVRFQGVMSMAY